MSRDVAIVGYYETKFSKDEKRSVYEYAAEAAAGALRHAGLRKDDVDGLAVTTAMAGASEPFWSARLNESLGLSPRWLEKADLGGASAIGTVVRAASAIRDGRATTVLCLGADAPVTEWRAKYAGYRSEFEEPYGPNGPPGLFGLLQTRSVHQSRLTLPQIGTPAVAQRKHALLNPSATFKNDLTVEEYINSRMISEPIRLLDCVMYCNGGLALVVTTADRARALTDKPVFILGVGERHNFNGSDPMPDVTRTGFIDCGGAAFREAGLRPADIKSFHPYDDFLIAMVLQLEDLGFCAKGEGGAFVERTNFMYNGDLPLNTGGGQISAGQPGLAGGFVNLVEAVRQLREEAGARQVRDPSNALVTGIGTVAFLRNWHSSIVAILGR